MIYAVVCFGAVFIATIAVTIDNLDVITPKEAVETIISHGAITGLIIYLLLNQK
jgi:hypothetical protein